MEVSKEKLLSMFEMMVRIRRFEEEVKVLFKAGLFSGHVHVCIGQEASCTGACMALRKEDYIFTTHRGHGQCLAKGMDTKRSMAELMGKKDGVCQGKGGSLHLADRSIGALGGIGILGAGVPIAVGAAFSAKVRGTGQVALAFFGEGASNQGAVHEAMNLAGLWNLPVIFFCETNQWAELSRREAHLKVDTIAARAEGYGFPGFKVDGNDVVEVFEVTSEAVDRARNGKGPTLIDAITYRWDGHYVGDPAVARPEGELEEWKKKDPIAGLRKKLFEEGILNEEMVQEIAKRIEIEIEEAVDFGKKSPFPPPEDAFTGVYV